MKEVLRWFPVRQCIVYTLIQYWVATLVWRCLLGLDPTYLMCPVLQVVAPDAQREGGVLSVLFAHITIMQTRAFV